ncbi:unnamed protein product [Caenorhabditis nigoni]
MRASLNHTRIFKQNYKGNWIYDVVGDSVSASRWVRKSPNSLKLKDMPMSNKKTENHVLGTIVEFVGSSRRGSGEIKENMTESLGTNCGSVQTMVLIT